MVLLDLTITPGGELVIQPDGHTTMTDTTKAHTNGNGNGKHADNINGDSVWR